MRDQLQFRPSPEFLPEEHIREHNCYFFLLSCAKESGQNDIMSGYTHCLHINLWVHGPAGGKLPTKIAIPFRPASLQELLLGTEIDGRDLRCAGELQF